MMALIFKVSSIDYDTRSKGWQRERICTGPAGMKERREGRKASTHP